MDVVEILGIFGIGSVMGIIIKYLLDANRDKNIRLFEVKKEAYIRAIAIISGLGHRTVSFTLENNNPLQKIKYLTDINRELSAAIMVANDKLRFNLKKVSKITLVGFDVINETLKATKKVNGKYRISTHQPEAKKLDGWRKDGESLEKKLIKLMRKDIGLK